MSQETLQQAQCNWPKESELGLIDHTGGRVSTRRHCFAGHGFTGVRGLRGGIDAWTARRQDPSLPRYTTETA
jgi:rhodanese-related sulfurtransferase